MLTMSYRLLLGCVWLLIASQSSAEVRRVPEDHKTIQTAIDVASAGDEVIVGAGVYFERIRLKQGVMVRSEGENAAGELGLARAERTIIDGGGAASNAELGASAGVEMAENSVLDGFTVRNVGQYDDESWQKHFATRGEQQAYEHIGAPGVAGIAATGVNCTIRHNIVHHVGYTGIGLTGVEGRRISPVVSENFCYRNMGGGIGAMKHSRAVICNNVCFENFFAGIGHEAASPMVVENTCYGNVRAGIGISEGSSPTVRSNHCYKNRRAGIGIRTGSSTRPLVEDNDCHDNGMAGIGIREQAEPIIRGNRCYKNELVGIGVRTGAKPIIVGNECHENKLVGIGQQSNAITVLIDNHCHHNKKAGIGFDPCENGQSTVIGNRVVDNGTVAVGIQAGWKVLLRGNEFTRETGMPPLAMVFKDAEASFVSNTFRGGGVAGLRVAGKVYCESNKIEGTSLRKVGPPNFAVWALSGSHVTLIDNEVRNWRHALHATETKVVATGNTVSNFHKSAFVLQNPVQPVFVSGNTVALANEGDVSILIDGIAKAFSGNE